MALTVTENEHWKNRITIRIDRKIEAIYAESPNLKERVQREARTAALASLDVSELDAGLTQLDEDEKRLERRQREVARMMLAKVRGISVEELDQTADSIYHHDRYSREVETAIERRTKLHADALLSQDDQGQKIQQLQEEWENLLDTVWLATSPTQVRELWAKVTELLEVAPTKLEQDALATSPLNSD